MMFLYGWVFISIGIVLGMILKSLLTMNNYRLPNEETEWRE